MEFISDFLKNYLRIKIDLFITNLFLDLIAENIDVGIRFGELKDSTLIAKKLGSQIRYVVASPEYLKGQKLPTKPEDLNWDLPCDAADACSTQPARAWVMSLIRDSGKNFI